MRALILASVAAAAFAAPALADDSATADFTFYVQEDCTFDETNSTTELSFDADNTIGDVTIEIDVDCNTPYTLVAEDGSAGGAENLVTMTRTEIRDSVVEEYATGFTGSVTASMDGTGKNGAGRYPSQDADFTYVIDWSAGGDGTKTNGFAAGNYTGALVFTLTGRDVEKAEAAADPAVPLGGEG